MCSPVGGHHWEDVTAGWPMGWIQVVGASSSPLLSLDLLVYSAQCSHSGSWFPGCSLERVRCCRDHLDWISDWTQLRLLPKLLRCWWLVWRPTCLAIPKTSLIRSDQILFFFFLPSTCGPVCEPTNSNVSRAATKRFWIFMAKSDYQVLTVTQKN